MSITVNLTPESEEFIKRKLESGRYDSASQVVEEALHTLKNEEWFSGERLEYLKREVALGLKDLDEGRKELFDEKVLEEIKAGGRILSEAKKQKQIIEIKRKIEQGIDDLKQGRSAPLDEEWLENVKTRGRARLEALRSNPPD